MVSPIRKPGTMTAEEFLRLPPEPEGVTRELWEGVVREFGEPIEGGGNEGGHMTSRNRWHSSVEIKVGQLLLNWLEGQTQFAGVAASGEVRCRLSENPETVVGIDVALFGKEHLRNVDRRWFDGPPVLAVEILSPSDTQEGIAEKVRLFLRSNVAQVWLVDAEFETVTIHRPGDRPVLLHAGQTIDGGMDLPGFEAPVSSFFAKTHPR